MRALLFVKQSLLLGRTPTLCFWSPHSPLLHNRCCGSLTTKVHLVPLFLLGKNVRSVLRTLLLHAAHANEAFK